MLVQGTFTIKGLQGLWLDLETISHSTGYGRTTPASWRLLRLVMAYRHFSSPFILLEWMSLFSKSPSSSDGDLGGSELELSSLSVFSEVELSLSFCFFRALAGRSAGHGTFRLLLRVCQQKSYHLLEVVDRLLLGSKHLLLLLLHSRLLFKSPCHLFWSTCHVCEGLLLHVSVGRLKLCDGRVLIIYFNSPSQGIIVHWGDWTSPDVGALVNCFRLDQYFFQAWGTFNIRLLRFESQLPPLRLAWRGAWTNHVGSHFRVLYVRKWLLLAGAMPFGWIRDWSLWQLTED